jgi:molybdate transport system ATP-binding protein
VVRERVIARKRTSRIGARPLIELAHCSLVLDDHPVLDDVSFSLRAGERWALVGPNGSGKTLLLKMLRGDVWPTPTGRERRTYRFDANDAGVSAKDRIAYVGPERQDKYVRYGWDLTVAEVVTTGLFDEDIPLSRPSRAQRQRVARVLRRFGLWGLRRRHMLSLSYGQRRLALVARAFVSGAKVLLLDEVFNGLDVHAKEKLRLALARPRGAHEWVLSSHRPKELPPNVTHVARIEAGRIVACGPVDGCPLPVPPPLARGRGRILVEQRHGSALRDQIAFPPLRQRGRDREGAAPPPPWLVRIRNASIYRDYRPVIRDLDWTLHTGEHWAVLGANGSGKSTLLNLIYGDLHPALGGTIERRGAPFGTRIEEWKRRVGWVSPELQADHYLAASIEEIAISGRYASVGLNDAPTPADRKAAHRWLKYFHIDHLRERGPRQVSYGQMRLALFARAMMNDPQLLLLDEPCTGLDADLRRALLDMVERLGRQGTQIVMAVHDVEDIVPCIGKVLKIRRGGRTAQICTSAS